MEPPKSIFVQNIVVEPLTHRRDFFYFLEGKFLKGWGIVLLSPLRLWDQVL